MWVTLFVALALCSGACNAETRYKNAAEFEAAVQSWQLVGKTENEALAILAKQRFACQARSCYREARGVVCTQRQRINLVVDQDGKVIETTVWKLPNGQLPSVCL